MNLKSWRISVVGLLGLGLFLTGCADRSDSVVTPDTKPEEPCVSSGHEAVYLDQGWANEERERFYYLGQGSQLIPYRWFLALELPDDDELFRSDRHLASLGFITQRSSDRNPDGLPIGFAKDSNPASIAMKTAFLGPRFNVDHYPEQEKDWLGFTCAACHTSDLTFQGEVIRIDGGPTMADMESFLGRLAASMRATASDDEKFAAFVKRVRDGAGGLDGAAPPREEFESYTAVIETLVERNKAAHPYGLARLDAFGAILNQITEAGINIPENRRPSSAPVSFPFLWDTPHLDWVQWNSSAEIPISRNVGEVLGVFAHFELSESADTGYASSARLDYLHDLEVSLRNLKAPPWPTQFFGEIDEAKAAIGKRLFDSNCANCHNSRDSQGNFAMTPPNQIGQRFIKTTSVPFSLIGTDPQMIVNFATRTAKPGILAREVAAGMAELEASGGLERLKQLRTQLGLPAPDFSQEVPAGLLLAAAGRGVIKRYLEESFQNRTPQEKQEILLELRGNRPTDNPRPNGGMGYKARPLNGVWATAPFLHNGSVPNLWELLKPDGERVKSFYVGSREFDPRHVGLSTEQVAGAFHFQTVSDDGTPIPGNSNRGHSGDGHTGSGGTTFTEDQRWAIIEYIKNLK